jgi:hypothetical protein
LDDDVPNCAVLAFLVDWMAMRAWDELTLLLR